MNMIKPIKRNTWKNYQGKIEYETCDSDDVAKLEQTAEELIKALIEMLTEQKRVIRREHLSDNCLYNINVKNRVKLIESKTDMTFREIKEMEE